MPLHVHVEAEITKGKYCDYDSFLGQEAVEYLKAYFDERRRGSSRGYVPPETINDDSPLIRSKLNGKNTNSEEPAKVSVTREAIYEVVHGLYRRAGLIDSKRGNQYKLKPHSIRKFFRTQLASLGVETDYIEYMMGHKISTYHDINMKGIEYLRNIYRSSGLSIRPKTAASKIDMLKTLVRSLGYDPDQILVKEALSIPHRTVIDPENNDLGILNRILKEIITNEAKKIVQPM